MVTMTFFSIYMHYPLLQMDECWIFCDKQRLEDYENREELHRLERGDIQYTAIGSINSRWQEGTLSGGEPVATHL